MAVVVSTGNPTGLLSAIKAAIDRREIDTWSYDSAGDFIHTPPQWRSRAWLRPTSTAGGLTLQVIPRADQGRTLEAYAVYHGRFVEMLLAHFGSMVTDVRATPTRDGASG